MKTAFIFVTYHTKQEEIERLKKEISSFGLQNYEIYFIDNTENNKGYASGVNKGIKKGLEYGADLFIIANPDISFQQLKPAEIFRASKYFDIWGFTMKQHDTYYYGGTIDPWRMSGGLVEKKPAKRFINADFVSGSLMCIKRKVVENIGFFDESYFMYYEDVDYCYRARRQGYKVGIDSKLLYEHYEYSSSLPQKKVLLAKHRLRFLLKWGTPKQKLHEVLRLPKTILEQGGVFMTNFFSLNISSLIGKILNFFLFFFLIRFFEPKEYGIYTLVWVHIGLLMPFLDLGTTSYGIVYLQKEETDKLKQIFSLRFFLSIIVFIATLILAFVLRYNSQLIRYIFLVSIVIFSNGFSGNYLIIKALKQELYIAASVFTIFNAALITALIGVLIATRALEYLFLTTFCFYLVYALIIIRLIKKEIGELTIKITYQEWASIIKKSFVFVMIGLLAEFYFKMDVFLLKFLKNEQAVGIYSAGYKFLEGVLFIAASYNIAATPIFAQLAKKGKELLFQRVKRDALFLLVLGIFVAFGTFFASPSILPFILKGQYSQAVAVVQIVIFALPFVLMSSVLLNTLYVLKRAYVVIFIFLFQVGFNVLLNMIFIPRYSYIASSYITVLSEAINFALLALILFFL